MVIFPVKFPHYFLLIFTIFLCNIFASGSGNYYSISYNPLFGAIAGPMIPFPLHIKEKKILNPLE